MAEEEQKTEVGEKKVEETPKPKESEKPEAHVSKYKTKVVKELVKLMKEYPIVGAIDMENMPAASLQRMRAQLREKVVMRMAKRRIMKYVFDEVKAEKKGIEKLIPHLKGMPALLFTKENPFSLFKTIKKNKSPAAAKPGQIAPKDIVVKAGPTPFVPGPVIGELGAVGIKTEVKEGKIHVKEDAVVVKEGEEVNLAASGLLQRLGIEPMEIGLDLVAVYEDGVIYDKKVLDIDEDAFLQSLSDAGRWALNLAVEVGYYTKETVNVLVPKAFREAKAVALEGNIMADAVLEEVLAKAERQASALKTEAKIEVGPQKEAKPEAPAEEKKEEPKEEKPKEEEKAPEPEQKPAEEKAVEEKKETPVVEKKETPVVEKKDEVPAEVPKVEEKAEEEKPVEEAKPEEKKEEINVEEVKPEEVPKAEEELSLIHI
ncbi:50S ribosomal protein L10 [Candidatus Woesearchaeota archaeon]|nr:50S ribosomal protein L10 [Candidatus Woesearchaeota archaeon]